MKAREAAGGVGLPEEVKRLKRDLRHAHRELAAAYYALRQYADGDPLALQGPPLTGIEATLRDLWERYGDPGRDENEYRRRER